VTGSRHSRATAPGASGTENQLPRSVKFDDGMAVVIWMGLESLGERASAKGVGSRRVFPDETDRNPYRLRPV
jgi:hypothetical protein